MRTQWVDYIAEYTMEGLGVGENMIKTHYNRSS